MVWAPVDTVTPWMDSSGIGQIIATLGVASAIDDWLQAVLRFLGGSVTVSEILCSGEPAGAFEAIVPDYAASNPPNYNHAAYACRVTTPGIKTITVNFTGTLDANPRGIFGGFTGGPDSFAELVHGIDTASSGTGAPTFTIANIPTDAMLVTQIATTSSSATIPPTFTNIPLTSSFWWENAAVKYQGGPADDTIVWGGVSSDWGGLYYALNPAGAGPSFNPAWAGTVHCIGMGVGG